MSDNLPDNTFIYIGVSLSLCIIVCVCISISAFMSYKTSNSQSNKLFASSTNTANSTTDKKTSTAVTKQNELNKTNNQSLNIKQDTNSKRTRTQLDCTVNDNIYDCSNPKNNKKIKLISGPLFKLSSSTEVDSFGKSSINYYILASLSFLSTDIISVGTKEIVINTLDDLLNFFNASEDKFNKENTIPDKCLNVSTKIREESKAPYNSTCIFFPGLNKIDVIANTLERVLFPFLPDSVMNGYFNMIESKLNNDTVLTILEYTMYLALLNKIKNSQLKYFTLCTSDNENINC